MNPLEKKAQIEELLRAELHKIPSTLLVPTTLRWEGKGLQPRTFEDYKVEYDDIAVETLRTLGDVDHSLSPLRRMFSIESDLELKTIHVSLNPPYEEENSAAKRS
ncbi:MAG TPA: hypothetical protein VOA64_04805 [Candidatus Dormibacteraeota bacterium]|nr:hypothetical protein [Candidatus Dormibacteraeota bacterium]